MNELVQVMVALQMFAAGTAPDDVVMTDTTDMRRTHVEVTRTVPGPRIRQWRSAEPDTAPPERDRWFADDKVRHLAMSFSVTAMSAASARTIGADPDAASLIGVGAGIVAGIGKEVWDRRKGGPFSFKDLTYDAAGVALGYVVARAAN